MICYKSTAKKKKNTVLNYKYLQFCVYLHVTEVVLE